MPCAFPSLPTYLFLQKLEVTEQQTSPYQLGGHGILVVAVQVALAIIRENNASYFAVHPKMGVSIADKHQQTHGVIPPANFILQSKAKAHQLHVSTSLYYNMI